MRRRRAKDMVTALIMAGAIEPDAPSVKLFAVIPGRVQDADPE
jgi:hypothetical protein